MQITQVQQAKTSNCKKIVHCCKQYTNYTQYFFSITSNNVIGIIHIIRGIGEIIGLDKFIMTKI